MGQYIIKKQSIFDMVLWLYISFNMVYSFSIASRKFWLKKTKPCFLDCRFAGPLGSFSGANSEGFFKPFELFLLKAKNTSEYASVFEQLLLIAN